MAKRLASVTAGETKPASICRRHCCKLSRCCKITARWFLGSCSSWRAPTRTSSRRRCVLLSILSSPGRQGRQSIPYVVDWIFDILAIRQPTPDLYKITTNRHTCSLVFSESENLTFSDGAMKDFSIPLPLLFVRIYQKKYRGARCFVLHDSKVVFLTIYQRTGRFFFWVALQHRSHHHSA